MAGFWENTDLRIPCKRIVNRKNGQNINQRCNATSLVYFHLKRKNYNWRCKRKHCKHRLHRTEHTKRKYGMHPGVNNRLFRGWKNPDRTEDTHYAFQDGSDKEGSALQENEEKAGQASEQKKKIRERYKGVDAESLDIIPAIPQEDFYNPGSVKRVAVYARVSTDDPRQTSSYELQKNHYTDMVSRRPDWKLVKIYADEGISGTSLQHRDAFVQMIQDCHDGKIDLIVTKSVSRFARNILDCIGYVRQLQAMKPPIGIFFETENIYTLNSHSEMSLSFIATLAQEESHNKSEIMNSSIEMRFKRGIFLTPVLLGYDHDDDGNLIINEEEAKTVRLIFFMYLFGYSAAGIAKELTSLQRRTKLGNTTWSSGSILEILQNERHCGDVLARKTFTPNYLDHKSKKNRQDRNQYRMKNHHEAIISRDDFIAVQRMISNARYGSRGYLPELHVVPDGLLKGFVLINPKWAGFKPEDYYEAALSVSEGQVQLLPSKPLSIEVEAQTGDFDLRGYEIVRGHFFDVKDRISATFSDDQVSFNKAAVRKLGGEYVELLIHPEKKLFAIRRSSSDEKNAVRWAKETEDGFRLRVVRGTAFMPAVYEILSWKRQCKYRVIANYVEKDKEAVLLIDMKETEISVPERLLMSKDEDEVPMRALKEDRNKNVTAYPAAWGGGFGKDFYIYRDSREKLEETIEQAGPIYVRGQPFREPDIHVSDRETVSRTITELITEMKETKNE